MKKQTHSKTKKIIALGLLFTVFIPFLGAVAGAEQSPYTIAWLSDTQYYSAYYPQTFLAMTRYLQENQNALNIGYIVHTGDLVDEAQDTAQWTVAREAMNTLRGIPYGVLAGNKDQDEALGYEYFEKYFGDSFFASQPSFGGSYKNNRNHYDLLTLGETSFLFVYLSYQPGKKDIAWANEVFAAYPDRIGVLCVHDYLAKDGTLRKAGKRLQEEVVIPNTNVYMVLCGHKTAEGMVPFTLTQADGTQRVVYQAIANYQNLDQGGSGYIRFISINEKENTLSFYTYSPLLNQKAEEGLPNSFTHPSAITYPIPWS